MAKGKHDLRLLICTQAVDIDDSQASVWMSWFEGFAARYASVEIVCLREGAHDLPQNVRVHSLGKESATGPHWLKRLRYMRKLLALARRLRNDYDVVLVHQNEEYVLTAGILWRALKKPVFMWRNHYAGSWRTRIAAALCRRVYYTSQGSYTARFSNAKQMPVGVDLSRFSAPPGVERSPDSVLFFGRMSRSKNPHMLLEALAALKDRGVAFEARFVGDAPKGEELFAEGLVERAHVLGLSDAVVFEPGVPHRAALTKYLASAIYVNLGKTGMLDKMIFEAAACGCLVLACSLDYAKLADPRLIFLEGNVRDLAAKLEALLALPQAERDALAGQLMMLARSQSIETLMDAFSADLRV